MTQLATRSLTFPCDDLTLEGALHLPASTPAPAAVVCHPHPEYSGDMDNNVVMAICQALTDRGFAALRFNFRGVGASGGSFDGGVGEQADVKAALAHLITLPEVDAARVGLAAYSFGAMVAAEVASGDLRGLALVSPPVAHIDLKVAWGCPAIVIGGSADTNAPADRLAVVAEAPGVELHVVPDADHFWWGYERDVARALGEFFERHFQ